MPGACALNHDADAERGRDQRRGVGHVLVDGVAGQLAAAHEGRWNAASPGSSAMQWFRRMVAREANAREDGLPARRRSRPSGGARCR